MRKALTEACTFLQTNSTENTKPQEMIDILVDAALKNHLQQHAANQQDQPIVQQEVFE